MTKIYYRMPERFWRLVDRRTDAECWLWRGPVNNGKYGVFTFSKPSRGSMTAHRQAFILAGGDIPKGLIIRHKCDTPLCCNPDHLETGTQKQNLDDMAARGRAHWQTGKPRRYSGRVKKLTDDDVRAIRLSGKEGHKTWEIALRFNVGESHIRSILAGKRKVHVV